MPTSLQVKIPVVLVHYRTSSSSERKQGSLLAPHPLSPSTPHPMDATRAEHKTGGERNRRYVLRVLLHELLGGRGVVVRATEIFCGPGEQHEHQLRRAPSGEGHRAPQGRRVTWIRGRGWEGGAVMRCAVFSRCGAWRGAPVAMTAASRRSGASFPFRHSVSQGGYRRRTRRHAAPRRTASLNPSPPRGRHLATPRHAPP